MESRPDTELSREAGALCSRVRAEMAKRIVGKDEVVRGILMGIIAGGHVLLEGVPGLAKTLAAKTFAEIAGLAEQIGKPSPGEDGILLHRQHIALRVFSKRECHSVRGAAYQFMLCADQ